MDCMQFAVDRFKKDAGADVSIPQAVWIACNREQLEDRTPYSMFQYRKRYGLHAMERLVFSTRRLSLFQYRKRYGLHAISRPSSRGLRRFNTASGMDCMQSTFFVAGSSATGVSIPQAVWIACNQGSTCSFQTIGLEFQYRKRYGLHAIRRVLRTRHHDFSFQYRKRYGLHAIRNRLSSVRTLQVSIPQAVWIACNIEGAAKCLAFCGFNTASGMDCMQLM